jgi:hypothetical protein
MAEESTPKPVLETKVEPDPTIRLAAGAAAEAYQIDYFREYVRGHYKPSDGDRLRAWQKAENTSPQFASQIAALGSLIPEAQAATDLAGTNVSAYFSEIANPIAKELLANILLIRLDAIKSPHYARDKVAAQGVREKDSIMDALRQDGEDSLRLFSTTDVMEAYLDGRLSIDSHAVPTSGVNQDSQQNPGV